MLPTTSFVIKQCKDASVTIRRELFSVSFSFTVNNKVRRLVHDIYVAENEYVHGQKNFLDRQRIAQKQTFSNCIHSHSVWFFFVIAYNETLDSFYRILHFGTL